MQRAHRLAKVSSDLHAKVDFHSIIASMKRYPAAVAPVKSHLKSNSWWLTPEEMEEMAKKENKLRDAIAEPTEEYEAEVLIKDKPEYQVEVHRNFATWHDCPPAHLTLILAAIEPVTFNVGALKIFARQGRGKFPSNYCWCI